MTSSRPTLRDVAVAAGVSVATVSRILNSTEGYSQHTRERVQQAMQTLGYLPVRAPEPVKQTARKTFGVVFPKVSSMLISQVLQGVQEALPEGYTLLVCHSDGSLQRTLDSLQTFKEKEVDGVIFASEVLQREHHDLLKQARIPLVLLSSMSYQFVVPYVRCDDRLAARAATTHLIQQGHRDIAILAGARFDPFSSTARVEGYRDAHLHHGLSVQEGLIIYTRGFTFQDGQKGFQALLRNQKAFSALFACSDELAAGVLASAAEQGIAIPDQISVMGFDDIPLCEMTWPPLTTLAQPLVEMGQEAVKLLLECQQNPRCDRGVVLPFQVIERGSVRSIQ
ncbi:substrate-binding domain-containing protein [Deinococcus roseus]|uniref:Catabolite control protein A n=1 Tax=Deinococcus roseus TaxID=392414 RepID=A0ABQ2D2B5_9DEIO|nr:substrate-binding domain-containing protein [Deinococcus roseus]GGJ32472.1 catabolite control protein A [Deinococcus roseus]